MASQPVDFLPGLGQLPDPLRAMQEQQQYRLGMERARIQNAAIEAETAERWAKQGEEKAFGAAVEQVTSNPTVEGIAGLMRRFPDRAKAIKDSWDMQDAPRREADRRQIGEIAFAAARGDRETAVAALQSRIAADKASDGQADPEDEAILADLQSDDPVRHKRAAGRTALAYSLTIDPAHVASNLKSLGLSQEPNLMSVAPGAVVIDEATGEPVYTSPYRPQLIKDAEGNFIEYTPGGGGGPGGGGPRAGTPRGLRNNNQGNIKDGPWARSQPGYKGSDGTFAIFDTPDAGMAAAAALLSKKYLSKGADTPASVVAKWAPSSENSAASRSNYAAHIASRLGIGVGDNIPVSRAREVAQAIAEFENGGWQGGGSGPGGARVIAQGKRSAPSETRSYGGKTYYKIDGRWYDNPEGA